MIALTGSVLHRFASIRRNNHLGRSDSLLRWRRPNRKSVYKLGCRETPNVGATVLVDFPVVGTGNDMAI
jgi:hypothetical protein